MLTAPKVSRSQILLQATDMLNMPPPPPPSPAAAAIPTVVKPQDQILPLHARAGKQEQQHYRMQRMSFAGSSSGQPIQQELVLLQFRFVYGCESARGSSR